MACSRRTSTWPRRNLAVAALRRKVEHLAARHAAEARGAGKTQDEFGPHGPVRIRRRVGQDLEGQRLQRVAGQNGGGLVEGDVHRRPVAAQIVVVHGREIVMDEGIAVQEFDGRSRSDGAAPGKAEQPRGFDDQEGPQSLAAAENGVTHGGQKARRPRDLAWAEFV